MGFWEDKTVCVTGGRGFLGTHLVKQLEEKHPEKIIIVDKDGYDLRKWEDCVRAVKDADIVIHLAAVVGGIGLNRKHPGKLFYDNIIMGVQTMEAARQAGVEKFVAIGTVCCYPKYTPVPFKEEYLWNGYPEETNAPYALAKKMLLVQSQAYRQEYGFNSIYLIPVNLYGPGDSFDLENSHVIPALIRKVIEAKRNNEKKIVVWGTGKPTREFLYVEDAARAILLATEKYNKPEPVNIGSGQEISIKELVELIMEIADFKGELVFDTSKPDGQPRRLVDSSRAKREFGFEATTGLRDGLEKTIRWYEKETLKKQNQ